MSEHRKYRPSDEVKQVLSPEEHAQIVEQTPGGLRDKMKGDPNFLPTREQIQIAFENCNGMDRVDFFHEGEPVFELLNEEYINALSDYLTSRINDIASTPDGPLIILEAGAGNGRLSHFLSQKMEEKLPDKVKIIATDSNEDNIKHQFPVEELSTQDALQSYNPDIVLCSWMPHEKDFTADFRQCRSVKEYILIGEREGGCCGDDWRTWGRKTDPETHEFIDDGEQAPFEVDGFVRHDLEDLSSLQTCRSDHKPGFGGPSKTISFRRGQA